MRAGSGWLAVKAYKQPVSVLVVIHTPDLRVLLLERADHPGYWQSVTGSRNPGETPEQTAIREVREETGIEADECVLTDWNLSNTYEIYPQWRHRYAPGVSHNTEHVFGLRVPHPVPVTLSAREHLRYVWVPREEAMKMVFSPSNAEAIEKLDKIAGKP